MAWPKRRRGIKVAAVAAAARSLPTLRGSTLRASLSILAIEGKIRIMPKPMRVWMSVVSTSETLINMGGEKLPDE